MEAQKLLKKARWALLHLALKNKRVELSASETCLMMTQTLMKLQLVSKKELMKNRMPLSVRFGESLKRTSIKLVIPIITKKKTRVEWIS